MDANDANVKIDANVSQVDANVKIDTSEATFTNDDNENNVSATNEKKVNFISEID